MITRPARGGPKRQPAPEVARGRNMPGLECVGEADLRAFLLGQLPLRVGRLVLSHLEVCPECEAAARRLDRQTDPVVRAIRQAAGTARDGAHAPASQTAPAPTVGEGAGWPRPLPQRIAGYELLEEIGRGG